MFRTKEEDVRSRDHDCRLKVNTDWLRKVTKKFTLIPIATVRWDFGERTRLSHPMEGQKLAACLRVFPLQRYCERELCLCEVLRFARFVEIGYFGV